MADRARRRLLKGLVAGCCTAFGLRNSMGTPERKATANSNSCGANPEALHFTSLREVARLIERKRISPLELTRAMIDRIAAVDPKLHSYATVMTDHALAAAKRAEAEICSGKYRGPLHGVPIAVKDLFFTKGARTMAGLKVLADFVPEYDATAVARLEAAGAVLLGKLNLCEGAMAGYNRSFHIPVNPWREDLWPGASSSGSAVATAAGLCFASLGTDTGGSIRTPAMANGVVGLKPTYGRVSRYGVFPLSESLDHVGPITRSVADAAIVLEAIAGFDPMDPTSLRETVPRMLDDTRQGIKGLRIGFDREFASEGVDPGLVRAIDDALIELTRQGAKIVTVKVPNVARNIFMDIWFPICAREARSVHAANYPSRAGEFGEYFRDFLELAAKVTDKQYEEAKRKATEFGDRFRAVLATVDVLAVPGGGVPFALSHEPQYGPMAGFNSVMGMVQVQFTVPADLAGIPTLSVRCGFSRDGLPYTIQFMGRRLGEPMLCRIGDAYERATAWHCRHPNT